MNFAMFKNYVLSISDFYDVKDQLKRHIYNRSESAFAVGDKNRDAVKSKEDLKRRQELIRRQFIKAIGGLPPANTPLNVRNVGMIKENDFRIEKIIFESRPRCFVTANLYIPDDISKPRGAVLFLCGHHELAKHVPEYQIVCRYLVKAGLIVLAQDPVGQGERFSYYEKSSGQTAVNWGTAEHDYAGSQCLPLGDSIARYFVHDAIRGIDYLCTRPEVDSKKIGVTGNSGGGTQTCMMMMCDRRIAAAAPGTFLMNRRTYMFSGGAQDAEQIWPGMTACGWDHEDILISMTPRPVRVLSVSYDFFPIEGTRQTVDRCRRFWEMHNKPDCLDMVEDVSTHSYTQKLARAASEFFSNHLLGRKISVPDKEAQAIEPSLLWCTKSGQIRGEIKGARFVYEENVERLKELEKDRNSIPSAARRKRAINWLRQRVFANRRVCDLNLRIYRTERLSGLSVEFCIWWSQEGIFNYGITLRELCNADKKIPVTIALWDGGTTNITKHITWIHKICSLGRAVMVLDVSGIGALEPNNLVNFYPPRESYGVIHKFSDDMFWLNDSLAAMRVYDVLRALDAIKYYPTLAANGLEFYISGPPAVYVRLARILDYRVKKIDIADGMSSYADWIKKRYYNSFDIRSLIIPGMLKYFDMDDF